MNLDEVASRLAELAGGDPFEDVRQASENHQRDHGCGLFHAGAPQMHLVASLARLLKPRRVLDLGSGFGYSTLWLARSLDDTGTVIGIDDDPIHTARAGELAAEHGLGPRVRFITGRVHEVLESLEGPFDVIHDDAWFARQPDHLETMLALLRSGGLLTMVNWFLLVDAITGQPRNDWESFAGPTWAEETFAYARHLAGRTDLSVTWVTTPPIAFALKV
jgi:predicted O-methyltransferase YrrM